MSFGFVLKLKNCISNTRIFRSYRNLWFFSSIHSMNHAIHEQQARLCFLVSIESHQHYHTWTNRTLSMRFLLWDSMIKAVKYYCKTFDVLSSLIDKIRYCFACVMSVFKSHFCWISLTLISILILINHLELTWKVSSSKTIERILVIETTYNWIANMIGIIYCNIIPCLQTTMNQGKRC